MVQFPRFAVVKQHYPSTKIESIEEAVARQFETSTIDFQRLANRSIAVTVGSRGIDRIDELTRAVIQKLQSYRAKPFIVPAMGSHAGGTAEGQEKILADYGITEATMGVPVVSSLETVYLGDTENGIPVYIDRHAWEADGIFVMNRIKPHTDFTGVVESGLMKMITVGLGKVEGAKTFHSRTDVHKYDDIIRRVARITLQKAKIVAGLAVLENPYHKLAEIELIPPENIEDRETQLLRRARELMPSLPAETLDMLIIDRMGKNISGVGIDPNITGRRYQINRHWPTVPNITRIIVLDLTEESEGNAAGIGLADFCGKRIVEKMDKRITYLNAVTSRNTVCSNIPLHFDTDREMLEQAFISIGSKPPEQARILRIRDTLNLIDIEASEALLPHMKQFFPVIYVGEPRELQFDERGDLLPIESNDYRFDKIQPNRR